MECWNANEKVAYTASGREVTKEMDFFLYLEISLSSVVSGIMPARVHRKTSFCVTALHEYHGYRAMGGSVGSEANGFRNAIMCLCLVASCVQLYTEFLIIT